jgi:hypothetical protein
MKSGNVNTAKEAWWDRRGFPFIETFAGDLRYAVRALGRHKGWAAVAILSLTLGIGVNTALFGIVNDILLQKLPVPKPDELISFRWIGQSTLTENHRNYGYVARDTQAGERQDASFSFGVFKRFRA